MTEQDRIRGLAHDLSNKLLQRQRAEFRIDQLDIVTIIDEGAADAEQAKRWQLLLRDAAADRRMGNVYKEYLQAPCP